MNWTTPRDLKAQLSRLWDRGELLRPLVTCEAMFPLRLVLKGPGSSELTDRFEAVRAWAADLATMPHIRVEWREIRHRVHGLQRLPAQAWVDTLNGALALLGRRHEGELLSRMVKQARASAPALLPWLAKRPLQAVALADHWLRLIGIVHWLVDHPRPDIYLRQVDVPGVDSKFIEAYRVVLSELLDLSLPPDAVLADRTGIGQFASRYGFRDKPVRIRFRVLDDSIRLLPGTTRPDVTLDAGSFVGLDLRVERVVITENETNFLAFPPVANGIVVFGAGYGWEAFARTDWLMRSTIHYWGDIDTHGFAILDQLRRYFAHVSSFLMDRDTLNAHQQHWGEEPDQVRHDLPHLRPEERTLFDDLRDNRIRKNLRLEQERVGFQWVTDRLGRLADSPDGR